MNNNDNEIKKYYAPVNIRFFKISDGYIFNYLKGVSSSQQLTVLLYTLSQCYYQTNNTQNHIIEISRKFNRKTCFLKRLKQSNDKTLQVVESLADTKYIDDIEVSEESLSVSFRPELLEAKDKAKRFSVCLDDLLGFKYLEHSIIYLLTRYGNNKSFLYHNYLCKILSIEDLPFYRQKHKLKRIFRMLVTKNHLYSFKYKDYKYTFERINKKGN
ncbi:hypothetical protein AB6D75_18755 [Vibrio splendidus]